MSRAGSKLPVVTPSGCGLSGRAWHRSPAAFWSAAVTPSTGGCGTRRTSPLSTPVADGRASEPVSRSIPASGQPPLVRKRSVHGICDGRWPVDRRSCVRGAACGGGSDVRRLGGRGQINVWIRRLRRAVPSDPGPHSASEAGFAVSVSVVVGLSACRSCGARSSGWFRQVPSSPAFRHQLRLSFRAPLPIYV
jgi:hypothetical protein